jgi:hypothetical protein
MGLDQQGYFWLSDLWGAAFTIVLAIVLLLWCHRSLGAGGTEDTVAAPVRARRIPPTHRLTATSGAAMSDRAAAERERRDANRRCVA